MARPTDIHERILFAVASAEKGMTLEEMAERFPETIRTLRIQTRRLWTEGLLARQFEYRGPVGRWRYRLAD